MSWADSFLGMVVLLGAGAAVGVGLGLIVRGIDWFIETRHKLLNKGGMR